MYLRYETVDFYVDCHVPISYRRNPFIRYHNNYENWPNHSLELTKSRSGSIVRFVWIALHISYSIVKKGVQFIPCNR